LVRDKRSHVNPDRVESIDGDQFPYLDGIRHGDLLSRSVVVRMRLASQLEGQFASYGKFMLIEHSARKLTNTAA
jgi:hypothetical protein